MKRLSVALLCTFLLTGAASAQRVYFMYFQSGDGAPFFLRYGGKTLSSSSVGALVLPNLRDSTHTVEIGNADGGAAPALFSLRTSGADHGFLLRKEGDALSLFNMQTLAVVRPGLPMPAAVAEAKPAAPAETPVQNPAVITSPVVQETVPKPSKDTIVIAAPVTESRNSNNPPTIDTAVVALPKPKMDTAVAIAVPPAQKDTFPVASVPPQSPRIDTVTIPKDSTVAKPVYSAPTVPDSSMTALAIAEPKPAPGILRLSESSTTFGFGLIYIDVHPEGVDTIRLLIPNPELVVPIVPTAAPDTTTEPQMRIEAVTQPVADTTRTAPPVQKAETQPGAPVQALPVRAAVCQDVAEEKDFLNFRKRLAALSNEEDMGQEARKAFKKKCYTVEQVRLLSTLFLKEEGKYSFFDAAWGHVTDPASFTALASELREPYYQKRFKALIGE